jgi:hypothetical protein
MIEPGRRASIGGRSVIWTGAGEPFDDGSRERTARRLGRLASSLLASGAIEPPAQSLDLPPARARARRSSREKR